MTEAEQSADKLGEVRSFYIGLGVGAIGLIALAVVIALIEPEAPDSLSAGMPFLFILLILAFIVAAINRAIEWRLGKPPLAGLWWAIMRAKILFQLSLLGALPTLALVTALAWAGGGAWAGLLWRAWILLLIGGVVVGLIGSLIGHLFLLLSPSRYRLSGSRP